MRVIYPTRYLPIQRGPKKTQWILPEPTTRANTTLHDYRMRQSHKIFVGFQHERVGTLAANQTGALSDKRHEGKRESSKGPISVPVSPPSAVKVLSMPRSHVELQWVASLTWRRHGFDSRTDAKLDFSSENPASK